MSNATGTLEQKKSDEDISLICDAILVKFRDLFRRCAFGHPANFTNFREKTHDLRRLSTYFRDNLRRSTLVMISLPKGPRHEN